LPLRRRGGQAPGGVRGGAPALASHGRRMTFAAPLALIALAGLPLLWWLLRVTPPSPRRETFPAIRLLLGLHPTEELRRAPPGGCCCFAWSPPLL